MSTTIYYFTGTGNSLMVAKDIASGIEDAKVVSIPNLANAESIEITDDVIGIIFPLYYQIVPVMVQDFIKKLVFKKNTFVFSVVTCGWKVGISMDLMSTLLKAQGSELAAGFHIRMPYNYIINNRDIKVPTLSVREKEFLKENKEVKKICKIVNRRKKIGIDKRPMLKHLHPYSHFNRNQLSDALKASAQNFTIDNRCNGCGQCSKICPAKNIVMEGNVPVWYNKCEECLACINWCPQKAIEYGTRTQCQERYTNPNVTIKEMIDSSNR